MEEAVEPAPSLVDLLQATATDRRTLAPDLSLPAATAYLDQLLSLPLESILSEASGITADAQGVESELINLCFREYPTFISVHRCSAAVTSAFDDFSDSLGRLLDAVPALEDECRTFAKSTSGVQAARAKAALVQEHQDKLFDLLEIPQLMDTCVRNGYYQEALELSAHTASLLERYPGVEIIQDISKEVDGVVQIMLAQLLSLLRESIKLPALVKTVGYLRRLNAMEESELCLAFLISRLSNFRTQIVNLERDRADAVRYVRKYIDLFREHVFDIISQFTTIFLENARDPEPASQLASFVGQCVNELIKLVSEYVPKMSSDAATLSSILVQLGYCSLAFARVGLDFAPLVTGPFSEAVLLAYSATVESASATLIKTIEQAERTHDTPSQALIAQDYVPVLMINNTPLNLIAWDGDIAALPTDLARFPPLAILVNAHLSALNSLRLLAPLHLYPSLASAQAASLLSSTHRIAQYLRQAVASYDPGSPAEGSSNPSRPSKGRAHLIRRNSETRLSAEELAMKRKEIHWVCIAFADTWVKVVVPLLFAALDNGVFDGAEGESGRQELEESLHSLQTWIDSQQQVALAATPAPASKASTKRSSTLVNGGQGLPAHAEAEETAAPEVETTNGGEDAAAERAAEGALDREVEAVLAAEMASEGPEPTAQQPVEPAPEVAPKFAVEEDREDDSAGPEEVEPAVREDESTAPQKDKPAVEADDKSTAQADDTPTGQADDTPAAQADVPPPAEEAEEAAQPATKEDSTLPEEQPSAADSGPVPRDDREVAESAVEAATALSDSNIPDAPSSTDVEPAIAEPTSPTPASTAAVPATSDAHPASPDGSVPDPRPANTTSPPPPEIPEEASTPTTALPTAAEHDTAHEASPPASTTAEAAADAPPAATAGETTTRAVAEGEHGITAATSPAEGETSAVPAGGSVPVEEAHVDASHAPTSEAHIHTGDADSSPTVADKATPDELAVAAEEDAQDVSPPSTDATPVDVEADEAEAGATAEKGEDEETPSASVATSAEPSRAASPVPTAEPAATSGGGAKKKKNKKKKGKK